MAEERLALAELLEKAGETDFLRSVAEAVLQLLMEADVEGLVGAGRYERSSERSTWRNGAGCRDTSVNGCYAAHQVCWLCPARVRPRAWISLVPVA
jgi:transposase-like protein